MLFYAYLFEHPTEPSKTPYVIYAMSAALAKRKFEKRFGKPGKILARETW